MPEFTGQRFRVLPEPFAVCRLAPGTSWPTWPRGAFVSMTATEDELSVICEAAAVPPAIAADREWRVLKILGPFAFTTTGVLASFATPLAQAGISLLAIATYDTDYLLVKATALDHAVDVLASAGHARVD